MNMITRRNGLVLAGALSLLGTLSLPAKGEALPQIDVSIGSLSLTPGGSGYLDVTIASDPGTLESPRPQALLDNFSVEFNITSNNNTNHLSFINPQTDPQLAVSSYVFYNNSLFSPGPLATIGSVNTTNDTYYGGDAALTSDVLVPYSNSGNQLLVRLQVTAVTDVPPVVGDTFTVGLNSGGQPPFTVFNDPSIPPIDPSAPPSINFTSNPGTVTMVAAVPGPAGGVAILSLLPLVGIVVWRQCRRRRAAQAQTAAA